MTIDAGDRGKAEQRCNQADDEETAAIWSMT
jgi:hypothetical protein